MALAVIVEMEEVAKAAAAAGEHQRERGRVRRDHQVFRQPALESKSGHSEGPVLVGHAQIHGVVGRLGDAPGHTELGGVARVELLGARLAIGWTMGTLVSALGVYLSLKIDLPTGATIVCTFSMEPLDSLMAMMFWCSANCMTTSAGMS